MAIALKILGIVAVASYMLQVGLTLTREDLVASAQKKGELIRALLIMLVFGPFTAKIISVALGLELHAAAALVVLALVGVVPLASRVTNPVKGDLGFGVVLTAVIGVVSAFTVAPTLRFLGYHGPLDVRPLTIVLTVLLIQALPLAIGVFVRARAGHPVVLERILAKFNVALILSVLVVALVLLPRYATIRSLGWSGIGAAALLSCIMAGAGYALVGGTPPLRRSFAAIANMPNIPLAIVLVLRAGIDAQFTVAMVGVFLVRVLVGLVIQRVLARSARPKPSPA